MRQDKRIHHLDSLRGIAALCVAISHSLACFKNLPYTYYTNHLLGRIPVIYFFLLSGFVLGKSLASGGVLTLKSIAPYSVKRIFRLYPVALASLVLGGLSCLFFYAGQADGVASEWLKNQMIDPQKIHPFHDLIQIISLTDFRLNAPLWTIRVEFFCSLLLPWMIFCSIKPTIRSAIIIIAFAAVLEARQAGGALGEAGWFFAFYLGYQINYLKTSFKYLDEKNTKWLMLWIVLAFIGCLRPGLDTVTAVILVAAMLALLVPCHWISLKKKLEAAPLQFLGKISFSFYVSHTPVLLMCWYLLSRYYPKILMNNHPALSAMLLCLISVIGTLLVAVFSEKYVERTFNSLGHKIAGTIN